VAGRQHVGGQVAGRRQVELINLATSAL